MARGNMVNQDAVVEMLVSKQLGGAALDVLDKKPAVPAALLDLDNVVLSPQQGSRTEETRAAVGDLIVANLTANFPGKPLIVRHSENPSWNGLPAFTAGHVAAPDLAEVLSGDSDRNQTLSCGIHLDEVRRSTMPQTVVQSIGPRFESV